MPSKVNQNTNSNSRKEAARKAGKCQLCGAKAKPGKSVVIDYDKEKVSTVKSREGHAHYCTDCAAKKHKRYEWKLTRRGTKSTTGRGSRKQGKRTSAKATTKATPKRKRATTKTKATPRKRTAAKAKATPKKRVVKKGAGKRSKASAAAEPF